MFTMKQVGNAVAVAGLIAVAVGIGCGIYHLTHPATVRVADFAGGFFAGGLATVFAGACIIGLSPSGIGSGKKRRRQVKGLHAAAQQGPSTIRVAHVKQNITPIN